MNNADLISGLYQAFATGDVPTVLGAMSPTIEWHEAEGSPYGGVYNGPQEIVDNVFMKLATEWDGYKVEPDEFIDGDSTIVALGHYSGSNKASGKSMRVPFAHVWYLENGKIVKFIQFTDTAKFNEAF